MNQVNYKKDIVVVSGPGPKKGAAKTSRAIGQVSRNAAKSPNKAIEEAASSRGFELGA